MLLSESTLSVLKNFASINAGLFFKKGTLLRTMNPGKSIVAEATIDEQIPSNFGITELNQLLSIISLHKAAPELEVSGNDLIVKGLDGRSQITYRCCAEEMIKTPPEKGLALPTKDVSFLLSEEDFNWILRSSSVLASPNISVVGKNGKLYVGALDMGDDSAHTDHLEVDNYTGPGISLYFKTENWKMIPGSYQVTISIGGISLFEHTTKKIRYWVALETTKK